MDPKLKRMIETISAHTKSGFLWERGRPFLQPFYTWQKDKWLAETSNAHYLASKIDGASFSILSWNIDFMRSYTAERMEKALSFLQQYLSHISKPSIIMLNEMLVSDLELIQAQSWVRNEYNLTDVSDEFWESGYYGE